MVNQMMDFLSAADPEVGQAVRAEFDRQQQNIELIASENIVSTAVLTAAGSVLTNKYAEGYPAHRYYGGCQCVDVVENIAIERAKQLFGAGLRLARGNAGYPHGVHDVFQDGQLGEQVERLIDDGHVLTPVALAADVLN